MPDEVESRPTTTSNVPKPWAVKAFEEKPETCALHVRLRLGSGLPIPNEIANRVSEKTPGC